jgi:hypothetical protein
VNRHPRRKPERSRRHVYAIAIQKLWHHEKPTAAEARELRRNQLPDGTYPLVPLVRPEAGR